MNGLSAFTVIGKRGGDGGSIDDLIIVASITEIIPN